MLIREDDVVLCSLNVIFVQWLCAMLSVYRKTTELTVLLVLAYLREILKD